MARVVDACLELLLRLRASVEEYCEGKAWWWRALVAGYLGFIGLRNAVARDYVPSLFHGISTVMHESGHWVLTPIQYDLGVAGGTIFELGIPFAAALYLLLRQGDWFGFAFGVAWLSDDIWYTAWYIRDANVPDFSYIAWMEGTPVHDWAYMLTKIHRLNDCRALGADVRGLALVTWAVAMALMAWMIVRMLRSARSAPRPP